MYLVVIYYSVWMWVAGKAEDRVRSFEILQETFGGKPVTKISVKSGHRRS